MSTKDKKRGLGRGLSALMADVDLGPAEDDAPQNASADRVVPVEKLHPNPDQPRRVFDEALLDDLAASIAEKGVIQPLIVREHPSKAGEFEIVAGERRWRAAQRAQVHEVPVILRTFDDLEVIEIAIIENIQRADLNPIEEAAGYQQLIERFGHTQEQMAQALGKSRSHITNLMRLLKLPDLIKDEVQKGQLSMGHARALLTADDPLRLAKEVVAKGLSVRETEKRAKKPADGAAGRASGSSGGAPAKDADTRALEGDLSAQLGFPVSITHKPGGESGKLVLSYQTFEQLDDLCRKLTHDG
jgi:ParB family chromosome partitioning protein